MADIVAAASPAAPEVNPSAEKSDGKKTKGSNVSLSELTQRLKKPSAPAPSGKLTGDVAAPAPAGQSTPVAEVPEASPAPTPPPAPAVPAAPPEPAPAAPASDDEGTPTDLSQLSNLDPQTKIIVEGLIKQEKDRIKELVQKRINKEVLRTKTLQDELTALRGPSPQVPQNGLLPIHATPAQQPAPVLGMTDFPLPEINDMNALAAKQREADSFRMKADDALAIGPNDDGKFNIDGEVFSKEQVVNIRRAANKILTNDIPQRAQYIQLRGQAVQRAYEEFPWLSDQSTPEFQQAKAMLNNAPWIKNMPNAELFLGIHVEGLKAIEARKKAAAAPAPAAPAKARPPSDQTAMGGGGGGPGRATGDARTRQALSAEIGKLSGKGGVSMRDAIKFLERKEQISQSR